MAFNISYTQSAAKDIRRLDRVAKKRLKKKIEVFAKRPFFYSKKLIHPSLGNYRWRVGNYRIIVDIHGKDIIVLKVGHRREIYKK